MSTTPSNHSVKSETNDTIRNLVLKSPRAYVLHSKGDGFGSHLERLINTAHETHRSFTNLIRTLDDLRTYIHTELEQTYYQYQFTIIVGKDFDYDQYDFPNHFALIEHTGMKILIFSSIGTSYNQTTTTTNEIDDDQKPLPW